MVWGGRGGQCGDVYIHILSISLSFSLSLFLSQPDGEEEWPDDVVSQFSELVRYPTEVKAIVDKVEGGGTWFSVTLYVMYVSREQRAVVGGQRGGAQLCWLREEKH